MEALIGFRVIDIACGSGDAQTLCITDDDNVWSWGDGDYGKLGRGGSDGCKIPMKVDSLAGLGAVKVIFFKLNPIGPFSGLSNEILCILVAQGLQNCRGPKLEIKKFENRYP